MLCHVEKKQQSIAEKIINFRYIAIAEFKFSVITLIATVELNRHN